MHFVYILCSQNLWRVCRLWAALICILPADTSVFWNVACELLSTVLYVDDFCSFVSKQSILVSNWPSVSTGLLDRQSHTIQNLTYNYFQLVSAEKKKQNTQMKYFIKILSEILFVLITAELVMYSPCSVWTYCMTFKHCKRYLPELNDLNFATLSNFSYFTWNQWVRIFRRVRVLKKSPISQLHVWETVHLWQIYMSCNK